MPRLDSHLKKSLFVILKLTQVFVLLVCLSGRVLLQNANATVYSPGQTLEPDCAPESLNCGVATLENMIMLQMFLFQTTGKRI